MKKIILTGLTAAVMSANAMASEVVEGTDTTTFSADSPAVASEVNGNFAALIAAINDNNDRISALEDASGTPVSLLDKISGATYTIAYLGGIIGIYEDSQSPYSGAYIERFAGKSVVTLEPGGGLTEVWQEKYREIGFDKNECTDTGNPDTSYCEHRVDDGEEGPETETEGSWVLNGNVLSITFEQDDPADDFIVALDGEVLVGSFTEFEIDSDEFGTSDDFDSAIAVGIRTSEPAE
jgi:hypothetical protein